MEGFGYFNFVPKTIVNSQLAFLNLSVQQDQLHVPSTISLSLSHIDFLQETEGR